MAKVQYYGIKFPIQIQSQDGTCLDLNKNRGEMVKSQLMHVLFTPIGQRLRSPNFGSNLIQFLFNPNDNETFADIMFSLKEIVKKWIPDCTLDSISMVETDNGLGINAEIKYSVTESDGSVTSYVVNTPI